MKKYDYIIFGAGIYGLYAAKLLARKGYHVAVLEYDEEPFQRSSYINQARVHNGYHYPRSFSTAKKSANYFDRFNKEFSFAINDSFKKIYAIANRYTYTTGEQFKKFCDNAGVLCEEVSTQKIFKNLTIEVAFETTEYAFCALKIRDYFIEELKQYKNLDIYYGIRLEGVDCDSYNYQIRILNRISEKRIFYSPFIINATYASVNQILEKFGFEKFKIKYEICEIIHCGTSDDIKDIGITVMDGPFFSVMPFGFDLHSLTSVTFTPHMTSYDELPTFSCQRLNKDCTPAQLDNCNFCSAKPKTAWIYMSQLAKKYLLGSTKITYKGSLFSIKPILVASELDDSRPTVIKKFSEDPTFISVLSGKINTIYDLNDIL
jgi:hypothetical protein